MGFFGKIRDNFSHGGVKVRLQAPSSVTNNQVIPISVTITAGESPQTINKIKADIRVQTREQGIGLNGGVDDGETTEQIIAQVEDREPFTLAPNETRTIQLQIALDTSSGTGFPTGQINGAVAGVLQSIASVAGNFENVSRSYTVHASADVAGISLDPTDHQPIQVLPAAQAQTTQPASFTAQPPSQPEQPQQPTNSPQP